MPKRRLIREESSSVFEWLDNWMVYDIPSMYWAPMDFLPRPNGLIAVFASGSQTNPVTMHNDLVTAGMDVIVHEPFPKVSPRYGPEPDINILHIEFWKLQRSRHEYAYVAYGPLKYGGLREHWPRDPGEAIEFYSQGGRVLHIPRTRQQF